jgi:acyl CoA:acetate/3-ketoacid CoA transferase
MHFHQSCNLRQARPFVDPSPGLAEVDKQGNVSVSKFVGKDVDPGGFINITQNAQKVVYCGAFTVGMLQVNVEDGRLYIMQEGSKKKFVDDQVVRIAHCQRRIRNE